MQDSHIPDSGPPDGGVVDLIARGYESKGLEYKGRILWDERDKKTCCGLVKHILAIANHGGGFLVIGVEEPEPNHFDPVGLDDDQLNRFESTRLNRFTNGYASPTVNSKCLRATYQDKHFVIVEIPGFPALPHICVKSFPDVLTAPTVYIRTDNNESAPVSEASDLQHVIERALRNRADVLLESVRAVLTGSIGEVSLTAQEQFATQVEEAERRFSKIDPYADKGYEGYLVVMAHPAVFEAERFTYEQLRSAANDAHVLYRGWSFMYTTDDTDLMHAFEDGLECRVANEWAGHDTRDFWRLHRSGLLFHKRLMWEDAAKGEKTLDFAAFTRHAAEAVDCISRLYTSLELPPDEDVSARFQVTGAEGRLLTTYDPSRVFHGDHVSHMPTVEARHSGPLADWRGGVRDHALTAASDVFAKFNWTDPSPHVLREIVDKLLDRQL